MLNSLPVLSNLFAIYPLYKASNPVQFGLVMGFAVSSALLNYPQESKSSLPLLNNVCYASCLLYIGYNLDRSTPASFWLFYVLANSFLFLSALERGETWFAINRSLFQVCTYAFLAAAL
ncbi:Hypothetical protein BQ3484_42 [Cedratvirus A11]|uniref:Uncharacterized protein n=1 Tax=Cedratvirus A11 TaxID=1903266 RepID=A0A1M7XU77_9VIRU|nr:Hypothetical protein BQ3484_42 [Cedratvirus A11]SHO33110.1 Hypothetical protein BQ3484_42 [Cedratvirus A11]